LIIIALFTTFTVFMKFIDLTRKADYESPGHQNIVLNTTKTVCVWCSKNTISCMSQNLHKF